jgi:hypothetical protein
MPLTTSLKHGANSVLRRRGLTPVSDSELGEFVAGRHFRKYRMSTALTVCSMSVRIEASSAILP